MELWVTTPVSNTYSKLAIPGKVIENIETAVRFIKTAHDLFSRGDETIKREIAFLISSNLGLKDRKIAYFNLNDPFSWLVEDASSLLPQNATLEPASVGLAKEKTASRETARSVWRGRRDIITNNFSPKVLTGLLNMSARFEVMRERMERVMAQ